MKVKLVNLLLSGPHGSAVREGLRLDGDDAFTEILNLALRPVTTQQFTCELTAIIARIAEDSTLSGDAVEVDMQFTGVLGISFANDDDHSSFESPDVPLDIETGDRFRILCEHLEVKKVRSFNLADEPR
jgi:hypothetical protein